MNPLPQAGMMRPRSSGIVERWTHRVLFGLFLLLWALVLARQFPSLSEFGGVGWPGAALLVAAVLVTVSSLASRISLQSALMAAGVIGLLGGGAYWVSYVTGIPFGPLEFPHAAGTTVFQGWFFVPAMIWVVLLLNARGLAALILEPAAKHRDHGLHLLGLTALLMLLMALALEPFCSTVHHYWLWGQTRLAVAWHTVPLSCLFAWAVVSVIASIAATPFLVDKHPRPSPPSREVTWVWALLNVLFAVGTAVAGLASVAGVAILNAALAVMLDWLVRKRRSKPASLGWPSQG